MKKPRVGSPLSKHYLLTAKYQPPLIEEGKSKQRPPLQPPKIPEPIDGRIYSKWIQYTNGIYQGESTRNAHSTKEEYLRHGEGVFLQYSGFMLVCSWNYGLIHGECAVFLPSAGFIICDMINSKVNGWVLMVDPTKSIVCELYHLDKPEGSSVLYDGKSSVWVRTCKGQTTTQPFVQGEVPNFVDQKLALKLKRLFNETLLPDKLRSITKIDISSGTWYMGHTDSHYGTPEGLGVVVGNLEMFMGIFRAGILHIYGRMVYQNGDWYHGEMNSGNPEGRGSYYALNEDQTTECYISSKKNKNPDTGRVIKGRTPPPHLPPNSSFLQSKTTFQLNHTIELLSEKVRLLSEATRKSIKSDSFNKDLDSPRHSAPDVPTDAKHSPHRKSSMMTEFSSPIEKRVLGTTEQKGKTELKRSLTNRRVEEDKEIEAVETLTFMKRATEDIEKRMNDIPSVDPAQNKNSPPSRRHKHRIFSKDSRR